MAIQNFPTQLQPIVQQGFLAREFEDGLTSRLGFRAIADRETFPNRIGESITKTRKGLKAPVTSPMIPSANTNFDNGLSPSSWSVEQYVLSINQYGDTIDLNMVTEGGVLRPSSLPMRERTAFRPCSRWTGSRGTRCSEARREVLVAIWAAIPA